MNLTDWEWRYRPIQNSLVEGASFDGRMFETYGKEWDFIRSVEPDRIWTIRDSDGVMSITAGVGFVDRLGYLVTEKNWDTGNEFVKLSDEEECHCYVEDGYRDSFGHIVDGNPFCPTCEGYGYRQVFVE